MTVDCKDQKLHSRIYANVCDDKYDASGYYMFDVTWDSISEFQGQERDAGTCYDHFCMSIREAHNYGKDSVDFSFFGNDEDCLNDKCFREPEKYINSLDSLDGIMEIIKYLDPQLFESINNIDDINEKKRKIIEKFKEKTCLDISSNNKNYAINAAHNFFRYSECSPDARIR